MNPEEFERAMNHLQKQKEFCVKYWDEITQAEIQLWEDYQEKEQEK